MTTRADLEEYDPNFTQRGDFTRFCCVWCGDDHAHDLMHQSLSLKGGYYMCHRCGTRGVLEEYGRPASTRPKTRREVLKGRFSVS